MECRPARLSAVSLMKSGSITYENHNDEHEGTENNHEHKN